MKILGRKGRRSARGDLTGGPFPKRTGSKLFDPLSYRDAIASGAPAGAGLSSRSSASISAAERLK